MRVSVAICTHDPRRYPHLCAAIDSVRAQTHPDVEVILVVDGHPDLCTRVRTDWGADEQCTVVCAPVNCGISASRNRALAAATGEVIAFMDDDAVAEPDWIAELVRTYATTDAVAVGGPMTPIWIATRPRFLPDEYLWLLGVTGPAFAAPGAEVRNTFGSNLSFKRAVLADLGGFAGWLGPRDGRRLQAEEAEVGIRLHEAYGRGVVYAPDAVVGHKIFAHRTHLTSLLTRCFWQGYSKALVLGREQGRTRETTESAFLLRLVRNSLPRRGVRLARSPSIDGALELGALLLFTAVVGVGFGYARLRAASRSVIPT